MKIGAYSPRTGNLLAEDITGINFGNVHKGKHCVLPVLIRPQREEEDITGLELYLQNNGGFNSTDYGYLTSSDFAMVESYDSTTSGDTGIYFITDNFVQNTNPYDGATGSVHLDMHNDGYADYVWLDVGPGINETGGTSSINYRFIFEYS
jgi:hypothetical protein